MNGFPGSELESERVGIADFKVSNDPEGMLHSGWLGAGLSVTAYDPAARVGGLLHAPLAESGAHPPASRLRPALFVDTGLPALLQAMARLGADPARLVICLAGGARLVPRPPAPDPRHDKFSTAIRALAQHQLTPQTQHLTASGDCRCSLVLATGEVCVRFSGQTGMKVLWKSSTAT